ncbi:MAG: GTP cyclohydrolase II, partial [Rhodobacteraceae bacterium]|nr:GTP cyclohydrolase II [Paracoccaceae bacterium]
MSLGLDPAELLARARSDLRMGAAVVLLSGEEAALVLAAETATAARLADLRALGGVDLALTARR